jgi:hypothetical protein
MREIIDENKIKRRSGDVRGNFGRWGEHHFVRMSLDYTRPYL